MFGKAVDSVKNFVAKIIRFIKFIPTVLGQVCMWLAIAVLALVALYLIINILANAIAGLLGIDDAGLSTSSEYEQLSQLIESGYDVVMPADELQEYYAYEYAVLMDLARNIEEAGTYTPVLTDKAEYDPALLTEEEWAKLCAESFVTDDKLAKLAETGQASTAKADYGKIKIARDEAKNATSKDATESQVRANVEKALANSGVSIPDNVRNSYIEKLTDQLMAQLDSATPDNEMSKNELVYMSVKSDTTGETSLVPYLIISRPVNRYTYSFVDKSMSSDQYVKDYSSVLRAGKGKGNTDAHDFGITNGDLPAGSSTSGFTYEYIRDYIKPLMANATLNANNEALYKEVVPGSSGPIDINKEYSEGIFYESKDDGTVTYKIPVKVLADRFMPKAVLLSSWYMLKQDETTTDGDSKTVELILEEIKKIYNEACLAGETEPIDNWLLVKDVKTTNSTTEKVVMKNMFNRSDLSSESVLENYAYKIQGNKVSDDVATELLYQKYNTDYDSREYSNTTVTAPSVPSTEPTTPGIEEQETLLKAYKQTFDGTLKDDIVDDLDLAITHHTEIMSEFMNEEQYQKAISDFKSRIGTPSLKELVELDEKNDTYTIYKTDEDATRYVINCVKFANEEHHHAQNPNGTTHKAKYGHEYGTDACYEYALKEQEHQNPYDTNFIDCFVPQIHVMFARVETDSRESVDSTGNKITSDVTLKSTAIVIIEDGVKYLYRVDGREIEDLAGLTNLVSFMKFDRYDTQMTNLGDWEEENSEADREKRTRFVVTDAFEAWPLKNGTPKLTLNKNGYYSGYYKDEDGNFVLYTDETGDFVRKQIQNDMEEKLKNIDISDLITSSIEIYNGGLAVVKDQKDENGEFTEEALTPPSNAAPTFDSGLLPGFYTTPGEAELVERSYINVKGKTPEEVHAIVAQINARLEDEIDSIFASYCSSHKITWTHVDENDVAGEPKTVTAFTCNNAFVEVDEENKVVIYPVEERVTTINQVVKQRSMAMYLPRYACTWSSVKTMTNELEIMGNFDPDCAAENGGYFQLIPRTNAGGGLCGINVSVDRKWRTEFYAKHFAKVRESDVLAMVAEWEAAGEQGVFAAYTYMRDIYSLLQKSKVEKDSNGISYVHEDSYTYMYMPDEILYFDESVTDKAYWFERLLATKGEDSIKYEENLTMRNKRNVKTWQIVDYEKYEECEDTNTSGETIHNVYAMWPLGGYLGKSLYVFEGNATAKGNSKIQYWGNYTGPGVHSGLDLYGRDHAGRIYRNAFSNGEANIKAEYKNGKVILTDGYGNKVDIVGNADPEGEASISSAHDDSGNISGATNSGSYINLPITINLDGTDVTFGGTTSAVYGYELYRLTKAYKDGEKAEKVLKETLEKEMLNTPVVADAPGIVVDVDGGFRPGFKVVIEHVEGGKVRSGYVHMKRWPEVQIGEYVGAGTILGYEGTTGNSGGYHTHHELTIDYQTARYPIPYLYPFFTPFYYEEKAAENAYEISSDYMSLIRTIFPYGEYVDTTALSTGIEYKRPDNQNGTINQVEVEDGKIKIQNYVPTMVMTTADQLHTADEVDEQANLDKIIAASGKMGGSNYSGDDVIALPQYFDKEFMREVRKNGGHILKDTEND